MKSLLPSLIAVTLYLTMSVNAQEKSSWKIFGDKVALEETTPLPAMLDNISAYEKKEVLVVGTVQDVCHNKGCWMVVADGDAVIRVEFKGYGFFVPWDSEGKNVKMQGVVGKKKISEKAAKHIAEEMKHSPLKSKEIVGEQEIVVFTASAVAIEGGTEITKEQQEIIEGKKKREGHEDHH